MEFITRVNKKTNLVEALAQELVTIKTIETTSKTNSNGKPFGFLHATDPDGKLLTGLAYKATADAHGAIAIGTKELVEAKL